MCLGRKFAPRAMWLMSTPQHIRNKLRDVGGFGVIRTVVLAML
ncbi:MAG: hypothetical protein R2865_11590 [Deinococcales bacterium]